MINPIDRVVLPIVAGVGVAALALVMAQELGMFWPLDF